ncbi:MAG: alpha/beta-type small acid-soluble spore protein [Caulobacteraceae bacterium]
MQRNITTTTSTASTTNRSLVPEAKAALRAFRDQVATEFNTDLTGYNGDKTAWECGKVGGEMVRRMIETAERNMTGRR